ncbi:MAG TPA: YncE family protein [Terriglobales bacterium]|nr:YncE family protein [Terriglobales bacterium]
MSSLGKAGLAVIVFAVIIWVGCNEAFRPIVIPIPSPGPDPQNLSRAYALSNNCVPTCPVPPPGSGIGALTTIDVPGDTVTSVQYGGRGPVDLFVTPGGGLAFTVNNLDDNLTAISPGNLNTFPATIPLPTGAQPVFAFNPGIGALYVAEPGRNRVAVISLGTLAMTSEIIVGTSPVAIAEPPNGQKVYVVNQGDGTVTVVRTADNSVLGTIAVGTSPVAAVASSDGRFVFVANEGSNDVTVIDTTNDTTALTTIALGASPGCAGQVPCFSITYDPGLKRVYTANRASNTVSIIRADQPLPTLPSLLTPAPGIDVTACAGAGASPQQVAVLPDGSRAYVANAGTDNVCVLDSLSNTFTKSIALPVGAAPTSVAASASGTKVYTANPGTQNISIIATTSDTIITSLQSPKADPNCQDPAPPAAPVCSHINPVYVTAQ